MSVSNEKYGKMVSRASKASPKIKDFIWAYVVGGTICVIGQLLSELYAYLGLGSNQVKMLVPVSLIFISAMLTAFKLFDNIAKRAGAGTLVPITGFANAVASPAIEFKPEGHIMGIGVKMFTIAGPVILYGTLSSVIYGVVYWIMQML